MSHRPDLDPLLRERARLQAAFGKLRALKVRSPTTRATPPQTPELPVPETGAAALPLPAVPPLPADAVPFVRPLTLADVNWDAADPTPPPEREVSASSEPEPNGAAPAAAEIDGDGSSTASPPVRPAATTRADRSSHAPPEPDPEAPIPAKPDTTHELLDGFEWE